MVADDHSRSLSKFPMKSLGPVSRLQPEFFNADPRKVARALLGKLLIRKTTRGVLVGRVVETEAYLGTGDAAEPVFGGEHLVAGAFEAHPDEPPDIRFVVDHQHSSHRALTIPFGKLAPPGLPATAGAVLGSRAWQDPWSDSADA